MMVQSINADDYTIRAVKVGETEIEVITVAHVRSVGFSIKRGEVMHDDTRRPDVFTISIIIGPSMIARYGTHDRELADAWFIAIVNAVRAHAENMVVPA